MVIIQTITTTIGIEASSRLCSSNGVIAWEQIFVYLLHTTCLYCTYLFRLAYVYKNVASYLICTFYRMEVFGINLTKLIYCLFVW